MIKIFDHVYINKYIGDELNKQGIVLDIKTFNKGIKYHVSNMNMPFMGSISDYFYEDELTEIDKLDSKNKKYYHYND